MYEFHWRKILKKYFWFWKLTPSPILYNPGIKCWSMARRRPTQSASSTCTAAPNGWQRTDTTHSSTGRWTFSSSPSTPGYSSICHISNPDDILGLEGRFVSLCIRLSNIADSLLYLFKNICKFNWRGFFVFVNLCNKWHCHKSQISNVLPRAVQNLGIGSVQYNVH